jgi:Lipocalin-like domain
LGLKITAPRVFLWRIRYTAVSIAQRLVGVWRLVSFEVHAPGQPIRHPFGPDAIGILMYTAAGAMAGQLMRPGRSSFSSSTITRGTSAELAEAATGYVAYAGTYSVDEARRIVTHHVTMSLFPNLVGTDQHRHLMLTADALELRTPEESGRVMLLRWQRA